MATKTVSIDASKVENLNGINYSMWKRRVSYLLIHDKTHYVTFIEKPLDTDDASVKEKVKWEECNEIAKAALLSHMQDDLIPLFEDFKTAKEILNALEQKYGSKSNTYVQLLLEKFNRMRMGEDISVVDHVNHMALIAKDLTVSGNQIPEKMQVSTILNSLPSS